MALDTDTAMVATDTAQILDFTTEARKIRARTPRPVQTPEDLRGQFIAMASRTMLEDLATWPAAFRRRIGEHIEKQAHVFHLIEREWEMFHDARHADDADDTAAVRCLCGCRGFNGYLVERVREVRELGVGTPRARE